MIGKLQVDQDPLYVAPEILESLEDDDEKSPEGAYGIGCDYWSLGVLAFTCCFGFNPFKGESALETFRNVVSYKVSIFFTPKSGSFIRKPNIMGTGIQILDLLHHSTRFLCIYGFPINNEGACD